MQLDVDIVFIFYESKAGKNLLVKMSLHIGELLLLNGVIFLQNLLFVIVVQLVQCIKKLNDFEVLD